MPELVADHVERADPGAGGVVADGDACVPSQNAFTSLRPTSIGKPRPVPLMPLRPNQAPNMSHSRCTVNSASTQPVSRLVPTPLPHTSSVPVSTAPVVKLRQGMPVRVGSVIENDVPEPLVSIVTVP